MHVVFSTKERCHTITSALRKRLWAYIGGIARENGMNALAVGGTDNHVHVLLVLPSTMPLAKAVQLIKGGSSKWIHDQFPPHASFAWQEGYGAFSIGMSGVNDTVAYIEAQEEHHRAKTFEEELLAFLRRHNIAYDERYVLG
jgi:REP element-mobilizing transposase RayT